MSPRNTPPSNQSFARCVPKCARAARAFAHEVLLQSHVGVRAPEVAVPLRDLVLEDEVVTEGVPGQVAHEAVVLVEIVARMCQDKIGVDPGLQALEDVLDRAAS